VMLIFNTQKTIFQSADMLSKHPEIWDVFVLGNGYSLNAVQSDDLSNFFTIGTNRCWLWGETDILVWRDARITEELAFFNIEKPQNSMWIANQEKSLKTKQIADCSFVKQQIDFWLTDDWKTKILQTSIRWNGIIFHAIAVAKFVAPNARIHLIGVDLDNQRNQHHFFADYSGFNRGFYETSWDEDFFHFQKRLDMMYKNFEQLKKTGIDFINHSEESRLTKLFGYSDLSVFLEKTQ